jgi:hypothetical protein
MSSFWQRMAPPHKGKSTAWVPLVARAHALRKTFCYSNKCCICVKIKITAGPSVTRITDGKIRKNTGKISFTPTFLALS